MTDMFDQIDSMVISTQGQKLIGLNKFSEALSSFGYKDLEYPRAKKNMDFKTLTLREIRVLNRIAKLTLLCMEKPL